MSHEEWLESRRSGIGGSDVAAVLGISPWRTPLDVWREKRGADIERRDNDAMAWGRALEPVIRSRYEQDTGRRVIVPREIIRHPERPYMIATVDGLTDDGRVIEIKTARSDAEWGDADGPNVPLHYYVQIQHYLLVTGRVIADLPVLIGGYDYRVYEVPADDEAQKVLIDEEEAFWALVESGTPPPPRTIADAMHMFAHAQRGSAIEASEEIMTHVRALRELDGQIAELEAERERHQVMIMEYMRESDRLLWRGEPVASWGNVRGREVIDAQVLRSSYPDVYAQVARRLPDHRRFTCKWRNA